MNKYQDKARGMIVGLAVGDALGAPVVLPLKQQRHYLQRCSIAPYMGFPKITSLLIVDAGS